MINRQVINVLPLKIREVIEREFASVKREKNLCDIQVEEIRIRAGKQVLLITGKEEIRLGVTVNEMMIREAMEYISGYSLYAYEEQLKEGFITIRGGHRVGIAGKVVMEQGRVKTIKNISSINIRISHQIIGCSDEIMKYLSGNILIVSPPRMGKTTLLRDILRNLANMEKQSVAIVDERSEIAACYNGVPQNDIGERCDVLDCCPKDTGMLILLRTMSPTYIAVDELASSDDVESVLKITGAGAYIAATIHGGSIGEVMKRKSVCRLFDREIFDTSIELSGGFIRIYNKDMEKIYEGKR
ncbi:MAG: stage III sporulation protein AA [Lachnospiraceae bacterium]